MVKIIIKKSSFHPNSLLELKKNVWPVWNDTLSHTDFESTQYLGHYFSSIKGDYKPLPVKSK